MENTTPTDEIIRVSLLITNKRKRHTRVIGFNTICPKCHSDSVRIVRTTKRFRYCKCINCGRRTSVYRNVENLQS